MEDFLQVEESCSFKYIFFHELAFLPSFIFKFNIAYDYMYYDLSILFIIIKIIIEYFFVAVSRI